LLPILVSEPIPLRTISISAPTISHRLAISFINEMRVASIPLAAYFVISADAISMNIIGNPFNVNGLYNFSIRVCDLTLSTPTTTLSGFIKSFTATPSLRNSGLEATSNSKSFNPLASNSSLTACFTLSAVPTGTVLLVTSRKYSLLYFPTVRATSSTYFRSACPSSSGGVPTAENITCVSFSESFSDVEK